MNILLYLPRTMRDRCFSGGDIDRLSAAHEVHMPVTNDPEEIEVRRLTTAGELDAIVTGWESPPLTDAMLDEAPNVRVIVHAAGSIKGLIPDSVWKRGIRVASCRAALAHGVAETTLGFIIAGLKGFFPCNELIRDGGWKTAPHAIPGVPVRELFDVTIGVVSAGAVGRHLLRLLQAFEVRVLLTDPCVSAEAAAELGVELVPLETLVSESDVVTLHAPNLPELRHMMGAEQFAAMQDDTVFINTARGALVDEAALTAELEKGRLFAFLDVTEPEPPAVDHPFRKLPNVVVTPHIAGTFSNGCRRLGRSAVDQLIEYAAGTPMHGEISEELAATLA